jgi:membrane-bound lytic murein transglycosylase D
VDKYVQYYTKNAKKYYEKTIGKSEEYKKDIFEELQKNNLPKALFLLPFIESGYREVAESSAKAQGLWQLMPFTAVSLGSKVDVFVDERRNYKKATKHAIKFLKELHDKYDDWYLTLAAYNCGPGCVDKRIEAGESRDFWEIRDSFPIETQNYVSKFVAVLIVYKDLEEFGLTPIVNEMEETFTFELFNPVPLSFIARASNLSLDQIRKYNNELTTNITPPNVDVYNLKLPISVKEKFVINFEKMKNDIKKGFIFHYLKSGQTISHLAILYSTSTKAIMLANNLKNTKKLRINQRLLIPIDPAKLSRNGQHYSLETTIDKNKKKYIHKIKRGESLWSISRDFNVTLTEIKRWNPKLEPRKLMVGDSIALMVRGNNSKAYYEPLIKRNITASYSIKSGESLWLLALRYKIPLDEIKRKNKIQKSTKIQIGKQLILNISKQYFGNK